jgi:uncharacterized Fe-S cluster-containing radical SAM superfamily protein
MADGQAARAAEKFQHPDFTADGRRRAEAAFAHLETLWINTGTLCNIECARCYIDSSPTNDRLAYITPGEIAPFLGEAEGLGAREVGFTGGEPFMNPHMGELARASLERGFDVLILTNAMRPMMRARVQESLLRLRDLHGDRIRLRVSLDHYAPASHDGERGAGGFDEAVRGLLWLAREGFDISVAGRTLGSEPVSEARKGYTALFAALGLPVDASDPAALVIFPEMDETKDTPEITVDCWRILGKSPASVMCASSRMVVKRKGADAPSVVACTLLPYAEAFELGATIAGSLAPVKLNHPHCSRFCVLGGASCSP